LFGWRDALDSSWCEAASNLSINQLADQSCLRARYFIQSVLLGIGNLALSMWSNIEIQVPGSIDGNALHNSHDPRLPTSQ
jgi:hypothetical protein